MTRLAPAPTSTRRIERRPVPPMDPVALATLVASAYVEVRAGRRSPKQLDRVLSPDARRRVRLLLRRRRATGTRSCGGTSTSRVITSRVHDHAMEVVVVLRDDHGAHAVAVRLDRRGGRWWVTDVGGPEDRQPIVPPGAPVPTPRGTS
jgi:hypothetical protein